MNSFWTNSLKIQRWWTKRWGPQIRHHVGVVDHCVPRAKQSRGNASFYWPNDTGKKAWAWTVENGPGEKGGSHPDLKWEDHELAFSCKILHDSAGRIGMSAWKRKGHPCQREVALSKALELRISMVILGGRDASWWLAGVCWGIMAIKMRQLGWDKIMKSHEHQIQEFGIQPLVTGTMRKSLNTEMTPWK